MVGPANDAEVGFTPAGAAAAVNVNLSSAATGATVFGMGAPKDIKMFYRWNMPYLTYSFDSSFVNYFGYEGMTAVNEAISVVNDFFVPFDRTYEGVSRLDLSRHGFAGNYNTAWVNTTAENAQVIDLKSLVLGMMVNQLGLGNPHRYAFSVTGIDSSATQAQWNFRVRLRNYDPLTWQATDKINGVLYAYRLIHDGAGANPLANITLADMEEFTADTSGNAWSSVAAIPDAFYGDTILYWNDQPTLFGFGVYYDRLNAMGGQYQPRHALTYDDAGGLKYLYRTNNYQWERLNTEVQLITPPQFLPMTAAEMKAVNSEWSGIPVGLHFPTPTGQRYPFWPRAGSDIGMVFPFTSPVYRGFAIGISTPGGPLSRGMLLNAPNAPLLGIGPQTDLLRGGIDKVQFYHQPFDSLLAQVFTTTNFTWTDTVVVRSGWETLNLRNTNRGASIYRGGGLWKYAQMTLGRSVQVPDFLFIVDDLGVSGDGVPIAFGRNATANWTDDNRTAALGWGVNAGFVAQPAGRGPGVIWHRPNAQTSSLFAFTKLSEDFELIWSGEASVVGNQDVSSGLWGWIRGPGPEDVTVFPDSSMIWKMDNEIVPDVSPPTISMVSDDFGATPIEAKTYTRSMETLTLIGNELASVTAIDIVSGGIVLQSISPVDKFIVSGQQINIPPGIFNESVEGPDRQVRVWNTVGVSLLSTQKFNIETGLPVLTATTADNLVYDRSQTLTLRGYGFKSKTAGETKLGFVRIDKSDGSAIYDNGIKGGGASDSLPAAAIFEVMDDTYAVLAMDSVNFRADGSARRLRLARKNNVVPKDVGGILSPGTNPVFAAITARPVVNVIAQLELDGSAWTGVTANGAYRRDLPLEINGTALNTTTTIEVIRQDGTSFDNPVYISLPNSAVSVEDNGSRISLAANAIPYPAADTNGSIRRTLRVYNAVNNSELNSLLTFAVNIQPEVTGLSGFNVAGAFNRSKVMGDDVEIYGKGFLAVSEVRMVDLNGSDINLANPVRISLPHPAVTVSDGRIAIDTSEVQFANGPGADTDLNTTSRIFLLLSARNNATTAQASRFAVGVTPVITSVGTLLSANNYRRDLDVMEVNGSGLAMISNLEIVDVAGNLIAGAVGISNATGVQAHNSTTIRINSNATGWLGVAALLDNVTQLSRRIRVTTPFGVVTSPGDATGAFTVTATPIFGATAQNTFGGAGYNGGAGANGTYTQGNGNLVVAGLNFRGVSQIEYVLTSGAVAALGTIPINPNAPPAGYVISADGSQLTITSTVIPVAWINQAGGSIRMTTPAAVNGRTQNIITLP